MTPAVLNAVETAPPSHYEHHATWTLHARLLVDSWSPRFRGAWRTYLGMSRDRGNRVLADVLIRSIRCRCDQCRLGAVALVVSARVREAARVAVEREIEHA